MQVTLGVLPRGLSLVLLMRSLNAPKPVLATNALKAANRVISTIDNPAPERGDELRLKAAESLLNRVGVAKQEQINHNVTAIHGVVLLPPKKEVVIDG